MNLTAVSMELVVEGYTLMVLFSDDTIKEFNVGYGKPDESTLKGWRWLTIDQLREKIYSHQQTIRVDNNIRLHLDKVQRLGWDYQKRGYK